MEKPEYVTLAAWAKEPHIAVSRQRAYQWYKENRLDVYHIGRFIVVDRKLARPEVREYTK